MGQIYDVPKNKGYNTGLKAYARTAYTYWFTSNTDGVKALAYNHTDNRIWFLIAGVNRFALDAYYSSSSADSYTAHDTPDQYTPGLAWPYSVSFGQVAPTSYLELYDSRESAIYALNEISPFAPSPITYRLTNCTAPSAPSAAASGSQVIVPLVFSEGFGIVNNSDLYVMNDGVLVTSLWNPNDNTLSFTMP